MNVTLSLFAGVGAQFLDNNGNILSGGFIYTYSAGTTTPLTTYTTNLGNVTQSNPIILDSAGRIPSGELWLTSGLGYKFVVKDSNNVLIGTYDNVPSSSQPPISNDASSIYYEQGTTVTAGSFIIGDSYLITSLGTTNFQAIGASANQVGTYFIATGAGSGTGTAQVSRSVQNKLQEFVSIKDFGAKGDGTTNDTAAIQAAINSVHAAGGGSIFIPATTTYYLISSALVLYANITLFGEGYNSCIHSNNTSRLGGITATGSAGGNRLANIEIKNLRITGNTTYTSGVASNSTGAGISLNFVKDCTIESCYVSNWSDAGISMLNADRGQFLNNRVDQVAQGIQIFAGTEDSSDNEMIGNIVTNTGIYNGIHSEGATNSGSGICYRTKMIGNTAINSYNHGFNMEVTTDGVMVGNVSYNSGLITTPQLSQAPWTTPPAVASATIRSGFSLYGALNCVVSGNKSISGSNYGFVIGAGSSNSSISGNISNGNAVGSCFVTDSGVAATTNVCLGDNSWTESDIVTSGNVTFLNRTRGFTFSNNVTSYTGSSPTTLSYYQEGTFTPIVVGSTTTGTATYTVQVGNYTRIGNIINFQLALVYTGHTGTGDMRISGLPYATWSGNLSAASISSASGVVAGSGNNLQAFVGQSVSYIAMQTYAQSSGNASNLPVAASANYLVISGQYLTYAQ